MREKTILHRRKRINCTLHLPCYNEVGWERSNHNQTDAIIHCRQLYKKKSEFLLKVNVKHQTS